MFVSPCPMRQLGQSRGHHDGAKDISVALSSAINIAHFPPAFSIATSRSTRFVARPLPADLAQGLAQSLPNPRASAPPAAIPACHGGNASSVRSSPTRDPEPRIA